MEHDIKTILEKLTGLETRFTNLEQKVDTGFKEMEAGFKDTGESIAGVIAMAAERFNRIENEHVRRLENVELAAVDLRHQVNTIKAHVGLE
jgi:hypothetical protein